MEKINELQSIFREVFDDETLEVSRSTTAADIEDWDSLEQMNLIVAIENHFGLKFKITDVAALKDVGGMADLIEKYKKS